MMTVMPEQTAPTTFGDYIRALRQAGGLTQLDLARMLSTQVETISRWENHHHIPNSRLMIETIERAGKRYGLGPIPRS